MDKSEKDKQTPAPSTKEIHRLGAMVLKSIA
jgi:hypothetical protein